MSEVGRSLKKTHSNVGRLPALMVSQFFTFSFTMMSVSPHLVCSLLLLSLLRATTSQIILRDDNGTSYDTFGGAVALDNDILVVGASTQTIGAANLTGKVFIYGLTEDGEWIEQAKLTTPSGGGDTYPYDRFGWSVAVSNGTVVVGALNDDGQNAGAVYVFQQIAGSWTEQAKLLASDGDGEESHWFGYAVAMHGTTLVASLPFDQDTGSVYVFEYQDEGWTQQAKLISGRFCCRRYGHSIAVYQNYLVVGSPYGGRQGSAYIYQRIADGTWTQQARLLPYDPLDDDGWYRGGNLFGWSVDIHNETVAVGYPRYDGPRRRINDSGSVHLFNLVSGVWTEQARLVPRDVDELDQFGRSVALGDGKILVGAPFNGPGNAYLFSLISGRAWIEQGSFNPNPTAATRDFFGYVVALDQDTVVIGSPTENDDKGSVSIFAANDDIPNLTCRRWLTLCNDSDECCSGFCRLGRCRLLGIPFL